MNNRLKVEYGSTESHFVFFNPRDCENSVIKAITTCDLLIYLLN